LVTDTGIDSLEDRGGGPFGFCQCVGAPAAVVGLDCFYIRKLKGVAVKCGNSPPSTPTPVSVTLPSAKIRRENAQPD
jgi:hypothetical protein